MQLRHILSFGAQCSNFSKTFEHHWIVSNIHNSVFDFFNPLFDVLYFFEIPNIIPPSIHSFKIHSPRLHPEIKTKRYAPNPPHEPYLPNHDHFEFRQPFKSRCPFPYISVRNGIPPRKTLFFEIFLVTEKQIEKGLRL